MKQKFRRQITTPQNAADKNLYVHVQELTDDLSSVIAKGLSFSDNLPAQLLKLSVTSGRPFTVTSVRKIEGLYPIFVNDQKTWNSIQYRKVNDSKQEITLTFEGGGTHDVTFFVVETV